MNYVSYYLSELVTIRIKSAGAQLKKLLQSWNKHSLNEITGGVNDEYWSCVSSPSIDILATRQASDEFLFVRYILNLVFVDRSTFLRYQMTSTKLNLILIHQNSATKAVLTATVLATLRHKVNKYHSHVLTCSFTSRYPYLSKPEHSNNSFIWSFTVT